MSRLISIDSRFSAGIDDLEVISEVEGLKTLDALYNADTKLRSKLSDIKLKESMLYFDMENSDCEDLELETLETYLESFGLNLEHYYNETIGTYDRLSNKITPTEMGTIFPDFTLRVYWSDADSEIGIEQTVALVEMAIEQLRLNHTDPDKIYEDDEYEPTVESKLQILKDAYASSINQKSLGF